MQVLIPTTEPPGAGLSQHRGTEHDKCTPKPAGRAQGTGLMLGARNARMCRLETRCHSPTRWWATAVQRTGSPARTCWALQSPRAPARGPAVRTAGTAWEQLLQNQLFPGAAPSPAGASLGHEGAASPAARISTSASSDSGRVGGAEPGGRLEGEHRAGCPCGRARLQGRGPAFRWGPVPSAVTARCPTSLSKPHPRQDLPAGTGTWGPCSLGPADHPPSRAKLPGRAA